MELPVPQLHSRSLSFAQAEVARTKDRAVRALEHLQTMVDHGIRPAADLARIHVEQSLLAYRGAVAKRAFEIRQLS